MCEFRFDLIVELILNFKFLNYWALDNDDIDDDDDGVDKLLLEFVIWFIVDATDVLLCFMWLLTRSEFTRAAINDSSPAITVAHTILAKALELSAGVVLWAPRTPSRSKQALWPGKLVPPPTVTTRETTEKKDQ